MIPHPNPERRILGEHHEVTRRYFMQLAALGVSGMTSVGMRAGEKNPLARFGEEVGYLTPSDKFQNVERHRPLPYKLPKERRLELGLERETWSLDVVADPESNSRLRNPLQRSKGTALDFDALLKLGERHAVRFLKVMTCNNIGDPLGMGLWEGVPLRDVLWKAVPDKNIRRVFYRGYHNDEPKQIFQSSLPIGRVLEDPPGENPVILCYKLNGRWLSGERGGPVRMIVPDAYGFKSIKWLQTVYVTNDYQANDTYALQNNDIESRMKSFARFIQWPKTVRRGRPIPISGVAQAGMSGVAKVQVWLNPSRKSLPEGDRYLQSVAWEDAQILPLPGHWGPMLPNGELPPGVEQFDAQGKPSEWPLRYALAHWVAVLNDVPAGDFDLRCRTIDRNGVAQPMPRPFQKSGGNAIHRVSLTVRT